MSSPAEQRARAARIVHRVVTDRQTTDQVMAGRSASPLTQELALGSLRHYYSLNAAVATALHRPLKAKDQDLNALMIVGAYQLFFTRVPRHAALHETVSACQPFGKPWARGLVNAVLRELSRRNSIERSFEHPPWLEASLRQEFPEAEALMAANNQRAPMTLRINLARTIPGDYVARLEAAGIASHRPRGQHPAADAGAGAIALAEETRVLEEPMAAAELPGFDSGEVAVQDAGAQFAAHLLAPAPGSRVLDACAAPGGKLFHLLERYPEVAASALDSSDKRLDVLRAGARRLGHDGIRILQGDATGLDWWDGTPFSHVLVDAPCSGTGTLRRHPDIKLLRSEADVASYAALQGRLLTNLWQVLEPGGTLLYCTCSTLSAENDAVVGPFFGQHSDAEPRPFRLVSGRSTARGWQLLPTDPETDGFYYARMTKAGS